MPEVATVNICDQSVYNIKMSDFGGIKESKKRPQKRRYGKNKISTKFQNLFVTAAQGSQ